MYDPEAFFSTVDNRIRKIKYLLELKKENETNQRNYTNKNI